MMRCFLGLLCAALLLNAQIDWEIPEPLDVEPLTDEEAAAIVVELPVIEIVRPELPVIATVQPELPVIELVKVDLPEFLLVNIPGVSVATVEVLVAAVKALQLDLVKVATVAKLTEAIETVFVSTVDVRVVSPEAVSVVMTALDTFDCDVVSPELVALALRQVATWQIEPYNILVPEILPADHRVPEIQAFWAKCREVFADQRMVQHDREINIDSIALQKWLEIYEQPLPPAIEFLPFNERDGLKMIAELRLTESGEVLTAAQENLQVYADYGYNACLITVYGHEKASGLLQLARMIRSAGMQPWFAWAGPESLTVTIFHDPAKIASLLKPLARVCQGYICAWRRTSAHLVQQDAQYLEYFTHIVRSANPSIYIVGESYYGQTWQNEPFINQEGWEARDNVPRNQSAVLIAGISTRGYNIENMLRATFAKWNNTQKIGLVLGEKPYYAATTNRTWQEHLQIKQELERRFTNAGCIGTITIHGDGSDRGQTLQTTDNLGKFPIK